LKASEMANAVYWRARKSENDSAASCDNSNACLFLPVSKFFLLAYSVFSWIEGERGTKV
jgi:hypothetical protein